MKRIIMTLLVMLMLLPLTTAAYAETLTVSALETIAPGRSFTATLSFSGGEPASALLLRVTYSGAEFRKAKLLYDGRLKSSAEDGSVMLICYADDEMFHGEFAELSFVSDKDGSGSVVITAEAVEALDANDRELTAESSSCTVEIRSEKDSVSSARERTSAAASKAAQSKKSSSAARVRSSSVSSRSASRKASASSRGSSSRTRSEAEEAAQTDDVPYSIVRRSIDRDDNKLNYIVAGAMFAFSIVAVAAAFYKMGTQRKN